MRCGDCGEVHFTTHKCTKRNIISGFITAERIDNEGVRHYSIVSERLFLSDIEATLIIHANE